MNAPATAADALSERVDYPAAERTDARKAIVAEHIANGLTQDQAAAAANIHPRTVRTYLEDPQVQAMIRVAVDRRRQEALIQVRASSAAAVDTLVTLCTNKATDRDGQPIETPAVVRVRAACEILDRAGLTGQPTQAAQGEAGDELDTAEPEAFAALLESATQYVQSQRKR